MPRLAVILLAILAWSPAAPAAVPALIGAGPDGGMMGRVARSPTDPNVVFAAADTVWKSTDGGATWVPYGHRMIQLYLRDIAVGPGPTDTVLASGNDHLYRSRAGGAWEQVTMGPADPVYAASIGVSPANPSVIVVPEGAGDGQCSRIWVTVSTDGGGTWHRVTDAGVRCAGDTSPAEVGITMSPTDSRSFWLFEQSADPHLWHTGNGGQSWTPETLPPGTARVEIPAPGTELVALGASPFHRPLAGGPWTPGIGACASVLPEVFVLTTQAVQIGPAGPPVGCAGSTGPFSLDLAPAAGSSPLLAATLSGVFRRTNGAWAPSMTGLRAQLPVGAIRLGDQSVVLATDVGVYREGPAGTWTRWADGLPPLLDDVVPTSDIASDGQGGAFVLISGALWHRGLADPAWTAVAGLPGVHAIAGPPTPQHPVWIATDAGLRVSDDHGVTWRAAGRPGGDAMVFDPPRSAPAMTYATFSGSDQLWVTHDRGVTWAIVPRAKETVVSVSGVVTDPRDPAHLAAWGMVPDLISGGADDGIHEATSRHREVVVSDDGGRTWNRPAGATIGQGRYPDATTFAFDTEAAGVIYAGTYWDGVWATADDGVTWGPLGGDGADQAVMAFLPDAPAAPATGITGRAAPWRLFATVGRVRSGLARIDRHPRAPRIFGRPKMTVTRTERVATCRGGTTVAGARSSVVWLAGGRQVARGRRVRLPARAVGLRVVCVFHAKTAFADVARSSSAIRPVGRPYQARRPTFAGTMKAGATIRCVVRWRGRPTRTSYSWSVRGVLRSSGPKLRLERRDRGRRATCTATATNRYGTSRVSGQTRLVH